MVVVVVAVAMNNFVLILSNLYVYCPLADGIEHWHCQMRKKERERLM